MGIRYRIASSNVFIACLWLIASGNAVQAATFDAGSFHTCAIDSPGGDMYCWGLGDMGQIGNGQL